MNTEILALLKEKQILEHKLGSLIYGSPEVRDDKYLYVNYREDGIKRSRYVGENTPELMNLVLNNSLQAKEIKKQIKKITKELKALNYTEEPLGEKIALNIDFAKRNLVDIIYKQAILEGVATTFVDTQNILEGAKVSNMTPEDVLKIVNLKHAWEFVLNKNVITSPTNFNILCEINKLTLEGAYYNAGKVRSVPVNISGTTWQPPLPIETVVKEELQDIFDKKQEPIDKAIDLLLYTMKKQVFIDGNKRTAVVFANHYLISQGKGTLAIPVDMIEEYTLLLIAYYEGKDEEKIRAFLRDKCFNRI